MAEQKACLNSSIENRREGCRLFFLIKEDTVYNDNTDKVISFCLRLGFYILQALQTSGTPRG